MDFTRSAADECNDVRSGGVPELPVAKTVGLQQMELELIMLALSLAMRRWLNAELSSIQSDMD